MAYRVAKKSPSRGRAGAHQRRGDATLLRNVIICGGVLTSLALGAATLLMLDHPRDGGGPPVQALAPAAPEVSLKNAIRLTYTDPVPPPGGPARPFSVAYNDFNALADDASQNTTRRAAIEPPPVAPAAATAIKAPMPAAAKMHRIPLPSARPAIHAAVAVTQATPQATLQIVAPQIVAPQIVAPQVVPPKVSPPATRPAQTAAQPARLASVIFARAPLADDLTTGSLGRLAYAADPRDKAAVLAPPKPRRARTPQDKLWGPVKLASLATGSSRDLGIGDGRGDSIGLPRAPYDRQTAVYVITDKKVYLPDGTVLEAHSGLREHMDEPSGVRLRMRGATPPHVYELTMRESLFHGVEAIRLNPIGGDSAIFGRDGLLAHTYLLGPRGDSNGCVSFKDYEPFLQAFKSGKINRLAVLAKLD